MAMFGNTSWLHSAIQYSVNMTYESGSMEKLYWDRLCAGMPYGRLFGSNAGSFPNPASSCNSVEISISAGFRPNARDLLEIIHKWIEGFVPARYGKHGLTDAESLLHISLYVANRALLTFYSPNVSGQGASTLLRFRGRVIHTSPGQAVQRPVVSVAALVVLSLLVGLQLIGLAFLAYYIYRVPTWTGALDAMAIARIGASVRQHDMLPPIGPVTQRDRDALNNVDGLVGINHGPDNNSRPGLTPDERSGTHSSEFEL